MKQVFTYGKPEEAGISSADISAFIEKLEEYELAMHSLIIIRHGKIVAEGYWKPFDENFRHRMYSTSKSFVAGAIGLLLDEGRISLADRVCTYFPEYPEQTLHPYVRETTIRDLLMMSSPFAGTTYTLFGNERNRTHWVESFFTTKPNKPAGTVFCYDTSATYILDVVVERITGMPFMDFLYEKILHKLNFSENPKCIKSPDGYSWGGSGVLCTTLDLAKYAYIFLRGGNVNGEQLLSKQFVKDAISKQIETDTFGIGGKTHKTFGYGYQIWCNEENGFVFNGMGLQHAFCYPDKDLMIVCTSGNFDQSTDSARILFPAVRDFIVRRCSDSPLPENVEAYRKLSERLASLELLLPSGEKKSATMEKINNVTYTLTDNPMGWKWVRFNFRENEGTMHFENSCGEKALTFGYGEYREGELPEVHYSGDTIHIPLGRGYKYVGAGVWRGGQNLQLSFHIIDEYLGNLKYSFAFKGDRIGFRAAKAAEGFLNDYSGVAGGEAITQNV